MTERHEADGPKREISKEELAWAAANLPLLRRWITGRRFLYKALMIAFVLGVVAHIGGYLLAASGAAEPAGLLADLLANLGIALWTGGILVVFVQILPELDRRSAVRLIEEYEAALRAEGKLPDGGRPADKGASARERT